MRQGSLFDITPRDPDASVGLAGLMSSIRAAMNRVAGKDDECRKQLVETIGDVARREGVALTKGGGKTIDKQTLDKWLQPLDTQHAPTFIVIMTFLLATGDASPLKPALDMLGLEVISKEDKRLLEYGRACAEARRARLELKRAESQL